MPIDQRYLWYSNQRIIFFFRLSCKIRRIDLNSILLIRSISGHFYAFSSAPSWIFGTQSSERPWTSKLIKDIVLGLKINGSRVQKFHTPSEFEDLSHIAFSVSYINSTRWDQPQLWTNWMLLLVGNTNTIDRDGCGRICVEAFGPKGDNRLSFSITTPH